MFNRAAVGHVNTELVALPCQHGACHPAMSAGPALPAVLGDARLGAAARRKARVTAVLWDARIGAAARRKARVPLYWGMQDWEQLLVGRHACQLYWVMKE